MISRYNRKPISHSLEIRGLSKSNIEHHPLPEKDNVYLPQNFLHDVKDAVSAYQRESEDSDESSCRTVTAEELANSWSAIQSYTGTGVSTERSSVFSWGYDEFDKAASRQVQQMFEEIDELLYECKPCGQMQSLEEECEQWKSRFPHLRILGTQMVMPTDEGYKWYSTPGSCDSISTTASNSREKSSNELSVLGKKVPFSVSRPNTDNTLSGNDENIVNPNEETGVIEAEGLVEEYLAFDCRDKEEEGAEKRRDYQSQRKWMGFPPVTPFHCMKEAVLDTMFEEVWREVVGCMEELVRRHWEGSVSDDERNAVTIAKKVDYSSPFMLFSALTMVAPQVTQARQLSSTPNPAMQSQQPKSRRKSKKTRKSSTAARAHSLTGSQQHSLNDLIVIQGIPLQQRHLPVPDRIQETEATARPGSSTVSSNKPRPRRPQEQNSSLSRLPQSARRRNPLPRTLHPINSGLTQSGSTVYLDEVVRGTRLATANDRLSSPPMPLSRNNLLPPISTGEPEHSNVQQHSSRQQLKHWGTPSRAHSALTDDMGGLPSKDRLQGFDLLSRPSTTHTFRSDTPYRRSFTVLDSISQTRPGRGSAGTDSISIGVTGVSLGISSSSFIDSFYYHPLGHSPIEDEEENEEQPSPGLQIPVPNRSQTRGGLMLKNSRQGL
ncbi:protein FAM149B1 isoform X1 [Erpetoichthys calabaricus]|uniref:protein FAM149B1 isoform X1 n=1 Tax=Erpetoichthys calabaricus TaxID=27687 RepID=UPI002234CFC3|nr:protein FAM149B1 isoform X1 [Erpetoichthys calabaricus]